MALFQLPELAEQAVAELSLSGFTEKDVALVLFSAVREPKSSGFLGRFMRGGVLGDTIDYSDGVSVMDGTGLGAVFGGLLGLTWGTRYPIGPVTMGTLGMLGGGLVGFLVDRLIPEKRRGLYEMSRMPGLIMVEVTALIKERAEEARRVLERHAPKQIAVVEGERAGHRR